MSGYVRQPDSPGHQAAGGAPTQPRSGELPSERIRVTGGRATIALPPRGVRMFIVER
ncbi:MAG TPA: hypothetical protein VNO30_34300 [Kofleriaceae bacterium]|nr:hypothetical protein [Kofleriaceae bacterium]